MDIYASTYSDTLFDSSRNAISTLLQPRASAPASSSRKTPTAEGIPPVSLTDIRRVEAAEFKPYILRVKPIYEQLQRLKGSEDKAQGQLGSRSDGGYGTSHGTDVQTVSNRKGVGASRPSINVTAGGPSYRSFSHKSHHDAPPLSTIPNVYFDQDFHLENPRTFNIVSERSEVVPPASSAGTARDDTAQTPRKALATNAILQEKLSWYMDTVEVCLISSISKASAVFFSALSSLRELHGQAAESVSKIRALRETLMFLDKDVITEGLKILRKRRTLHNLGHMSDVILQLKQVMNGVAHSETLVDKGEIEMALTEIDGTERLMAGERGGEFGGDMSTNTRLRDLSRAAALQGAVRDMAILRARIGKVFETKVHEILIEDLRHHVQSVSREEVLLRWEGASTSRRAKGSPAREPLATPTYMRMTDELRAALVPNVTGLHRSRSVSTAMQAYRDLVLREIRNVVRRELPSSTDDAETGTSASTGTNQEKSSNLARNIRAFDAADSERLFSTIFIGVAETLRRLKTQSSVLLGIACEIGDCDAEVPTKYPMIRSSNMIQDPASQASIFEIQDEMHDALDLPDLLCQTVDISHQKINKLLQVRSEQSMSKPLVHFLRYFSLSRLFANECEAISGRAGTSLRTIVNSHVDIQAHGEREAQYLAQGMGADNWQVKDLTTKDDEILQQILECSTSDPLADTTVTTMVRGATIEDETFLLPYSVILCVEGVAHHLQLIAGIPSMMSDIAKSLVSYLQLFDSRCRQLILGAGAVRSAGLRNITTTHLALASRAASFIASITPYIREFVLRHAPAGGPLSANLVDEFDKVRRAFQEHQDVIYQKLVEIMASRAGTMSKKAREMEWGKESAADVHKYMADLAKDTGKLYKALSKYLPKRAVGLVMTLVFTSYKDQLGKAFNEAVQSHISRLTQGRRLVANVLCSMLRDVEHLVRKLGKIEGFDDLGTYLIEIIKSKKM